ncbi:MAG TPA: hypothetical protein VGV69_08570, partial [Solirubrobacterales bacterium]|nr:hypothetical protein [Solirubrobacterales bacterium]
IADDRGTPISAPEAGGPPAINTSNFADVWCITSGTCFAVGNSDASGSDQWQVKRWTWGSGWLTQDLAPPDGAAFSRLRGVSCASTSSCLAVGSYEDDREGETLALAAEWDGEDWQRLAVPKPEGAKEAVLSGVFCHSGGTCFAVGRYIDSGGVQKSLGMTWNGVKWTIVTVPTPSGGSVPELLDVACVSTSECRAVGSYVNSSAALKSLIMVWNGSNWSAGSGPDPSGATASRLSGIDCVSTICAAAGSYTDSGGVQQPLLLWRSSGSWAVASAPKAEGALATELTTVSCVSTTSCTAAGSYKDERRKLPLVVALASGTWSIQSAESADYGATAVELTGASCTSTSTCNIVGSITYGHGAPRREFSYYRSEGAWVADKPEQLHRPWVRTGVGVVTSRLGDVSCPTSSISACVSVGTVESGKEDASKSQLASVGTGTNPAAQSAAPGPSGAIRSSLFGVSCTSTSSCWAVGNFHNATEGGRKNFGTRWNGSSWAPAALPAPEAAVGAFSEAVSCGSASDCVAVGGWIDSEGVEKPLAVRWNGTTWSQITPTAPSGALETTLNDVSCASATKCAAVGGYADAEGALHPLAYSWDGKAWSSISVSALSGGYQDEFTTVSCSTGSCFGLGRYIDAAGRPIAFATKPATTESMSAWTSVSLPVPAEAQGLGIQTVDCASASRCLAVGDRDNGAGRTPWAASWNGGTWTSSPISFDAAKGAARALAVDCVSSSSCALVGYASSATWSRRENLFAQLSWPSPGEAIGVEDSVGAASSGSMSAASCTQVGGYTCIGVGNISGPLVSHSYGSSISGWALGENGWKEIAQPTGIADASGSPAVADVDCYSASACTAVGGSSTAPQISRWNGSAWSKQTATAPAESTSQAIQGVSCPTSGSCVAAGYFVKAGVEHPLAYRWKEGTWSTEALDLLNLSNKRLKDVSCASASSCVAVGYSALTAAGVIYEWNGTAWASKTVPSIAGSSSSDLVGVSCTAGNQCTAVGTYKDTGTSKEHGLVLRWNGTAWVQQDDSEAAETKSYSAVSCYSRVGCVATAAAYGEDPSVVLAWNGSEWSEEETYVGSSGSTPDVSFKDVSCASAFDCVVVGKISGAAETESVLALEPLPGYADGEFGEYEEEGEGEALAFHFDETQEAQITDIIAHDPLVRQKLGGAKYSLETGPWTAEPEGTEVLAGAVALLHLDSPRDWPRFEQWPVVSAFPRHEPKDYGQKLLELKARKVAEVLVFVAAVQDADGNLTSGEVVGIEPQSDGPAEYMLGPNVEINEEFAGVND